MAYSNRLRSDFVVQEATERDSNQVAQKVALWNPDGTPFVTEAVSRSHRFAFGSAAPFPADGRNVYQASPGRYDTRTFQGVSQSFPVFEFAATAGDGDASIIETYIDFTLNSADMGVFEDVATGTPVTYSLGVSYVVDSVAAMTVPNAWPEPIPAVYDPSAMVSGDVASAMFYCDTEGEYPNFPGPQWTFFSGSWMWTGYDTVLEFHGHWNAAAPHTDFAFSRSDGASVGVMLHYLDVKHRL